MFFALDPLTMQAVILISALLVVGIIVCITRGNENSMIIHIIGIAAVSIIAMYAMSFTLLPKPGVKELLFIFGCLVLVVVIIVVIAIVNSQARSEASATERERHRSDARQAEIQHEKECKAEEDRKAKENKGWISLPWRS